MSSSCMRYAKEFLPYRLSTNLGALRLATITTVTKSWECCGIHALEAIHIRSSARLPFKFDTCNGAAERNI